MDKVASFIYSLAEQHSIFVYLFAFLVSFFESFFIVGEFVPGAIFAFGAGFVASKDVVDIYILFLCGILGAILADLSSFYLAFLFYDRLKDRPLVKRQDKLFEKGVEFFKKFGGLSVFVGRFIGVLRPIVPFIAGIFRMNQFEFMFWAVFSGIVWGVAYFGAGYMFGENLIVIEKLMRECNFALIGIVFIVFTVYLLKRNVN